MKIEVEFTKNGIIQRMEVITPFGERDIVEKEYTYDKIHDKKWCLEVYDIEPIIEEGILKSIIIRGAICSRNKNSQVDSVGRESIETYSWGSEDFYESCIKKYIPDVRGRALSDLKSIIGYMCNNGVSRREAIKKVAKKRGITYNTVLSNVTRTLHICTQELDEILTQIIKCCKTAQDIQVDK